MLSTASQPCRLSQQRMTWLQNPKCFFIPQGWALESKWGDDGPLDNACTAVAAFAWYQLQHQANFDPRQGINPSGRVCKGKKIWSDDSMKLYLGQQLPWGCQGYLAGVSGGSRHRQRHECWVQNGFRKLMASFWQSSQRTPSHWVLHSIPVPKIHWKLSFFSAYHNIVLVKNVSRRQLISLLPSHSFCSAAEIPKEQHNQNEIWFWVKKSVQMQVLYSKFKVRKRKANLKINFGLNFISSYTFTS